MATSTYDLILSRVFNVPAVRLWDAWRDPALLKQWWGPNGFTAPVAKLDLREGGQSLVCMRAPEEWGGRDYYNTWSYTLIRPHSRIEYVVGFCDANRQGLDPATLGVPEGVPREVPHEITFEAIDDHTTKLTVIERGYTTVQGRDTSRVGMEQCLDRMAAAFASSRLLGE